MDDHYSIRSVCKSAIKSLSKPFNVNKTVDEIQKLISDSKDKFKISWVKAHVGILGNEEADMLAMTAAINANNDTHYYLEKPISHLKRILKEITVKQWQFDWDYGDKGRETYDYFPKVNNNRLISDFFLAQLYTAHGAFLEYLHKCKKADTPDCACGSEGRPILFLTECPLTQANPLAHITTENKKEWYKQVANNKHVQNKAKIVIRWLQDNCDSITTLSKYRLIMLYEE